MTLNLRVIRSTGNISSEAFILVTGSESGDCRSQKSSENRWQKPFEIICSHVAVLKLKIYPDENWKDNNCIGQATFRAPIFIKKNPQMTLTKSQQTEITVENSGKSIGTLKIIATFDKAKKFMGDLSCVKGLDLGAPSKNPVTFYKGYCPNSNLYSSLDYLLCEKELKREFKVMEPHYRDQ